MLNIPVNKSRTRPSVFATKPKTQPRLSLNLHTMPQTADGNFKKWLVLGLLVFGLMVIIAILLLW